MEKLAIAWVKSKERLQSKELSDLERDAQKRSEANNMFVKVLWGVFWVLGAWLVVNLIMTTLASSNVPQFLSN